MKTLVTLILIAMVARTAAAQTGGESGGSKDTMSASCPCQDYYRRYVGQHNAQSQGFYWLDSTTGHLKEYDRSLEEWEDHGTYQGMEPGPKGTYILMSDNYDGVYVLNTQTGQGWRFDGSDWLRIESEN